MPAMTLKKKHTSNYTIKGCLEICRFYKNHVSTNGKSFTQEGPDRAVLNIMKYVHNKDDIQESSKRSYLTQTNSLIKLMRVRLNIDVKEQLLAHIAMYKKISLRDKLNIDKVAQPPITSKDIRHCINSIIAENDGGKQGANRCTVTRLEFCLSNMLPSPIKLLSTSSKYFLF